MAAPYPPPQHVAPQQGNGLAVAGMVLGILGLVLCWIPFFGWLIAVVGIVLGAIGWSKANKLGGRGKGMAIAGTVCGIVGLAIGIVVLVITMTAVSAFKGYVDKAKASESRLQLRRIEARAKTYFMERGEFPRGSAPLTPATDCCAEHTLRCQPDPQAWTDPVWQALDFTVDEPTYYRFSYESDGKTFTAKAVGDLDCDGSPSETEVTGRIVEGNPVTEISEPTPD